jgi:hypothetical protein
VYHLIVDAGTIRVLDSGRERISVKSANAVLAAGHYRVPMTERLVPSTRHYGPGRIFIDELTQRDVQSLVVAEKAEVFFDDRVKIEGIPSLPLGRCSEKSIHGGGETMATSLALSRFQPLTPSDRGIRVQNADLVKLIEFIDRRLSISQLIVLSVLAPCARGTDK